MNRSLDMSLMLCRVGIKEIKKKAEEAEALQKMIQIFGIACGLGMGSKYYRLHLVIN